MKIQCDVCEKAPATVICCADEAALCAKCDIEVHAANKLASKHQRLLLQSLSNTLPPCDICQEKAAFIFCVEDRALFCRDVMSQSILLVASLQTTSGFLPPESDLLSLQVARRTARRATKSQSQSHLIIMHNRLASKCPHSNLQASLHHRGLLMTYCISQILNLLIRKNNLSLES